MWYAELPDDCLGRMYLRLSVADIYDTTTSMIPIPKLETAMRICLELNLNETQSRDMIKKAGYNMDSSRSEKKCAD